jgi:hypothetical protein
MAIQRTTANTNDVAMDSQSSTYSNARAGTGSTPTGDSSDTTAPGVGQHKVSLYHCYETLMAFGFTAVAATQLLVSSFLDIRFAAFEGSVDRDHEYREFDFGTTPDVPGDFRAGSLLSGFPLLGTVKGVNSGYTAYYPYVAGSKILHDRIMTGTTPLRTILSSSRMRLANVPTGAERATTVMANYGDSGYRPKLVMKTLTNSRLARIGGSSAQLSDGTHVCLTWDGSTLKLVHSPDGTTNNDIDSGIDVGTGANQFDMTTAGWQTTSLCVEDTDSIWVVGKAGNAANSIVVRGYDKTPGSYAWTEKSPRQMAMPAYEFAENADVPINNLAVTWNKTSNRGHLMVIGSHRQGSGDAASTFYATISCLNTAQGTGTFIASSDIDPSFFELNTDEAIGTRPVNDTGNCMDVWGDGLNGYAVIADGTMGVNNDPTTGYVAIGKYTLNTVGQYVSHKAFGRRQIVASKEIEPETKAKIVPLDAGRIAVCFGGEIRVYSTSGSYLGGADYKAISSFNAATTVAHDYIYDKASGSVWFYYIDAAVATRTLKRNAFSLTSYSFTATGSEVSVSTTVGAASSTNPSIRLPRGRTNERKIRVDVGNITSGGTHSMIALADSLNVAPFAPTLTLKSNFNASNPATFNWTFSDANTADFQTAFQLQIIDASDSSVDHDTGKVSSLYSTYTLSAGVLTNGKNYQWKVRVYDANDVVSATYSSLGTFSTLSSSITTVTVPAADNPADALSSSYTISWSSTVLTQAKYRVVLINTQTGTTILNTGFVVSVATSYTLTGLEDGVQYRVEVTIRNSIDTESSPGIRYITPNYVEPAKPVVSPSVGDSYIELAIGNASGPQILGPEDSSFEEGITGWAATAATLLWDTAQFHTGTHAQKLTANGTGQALSRQPVSSYGVPVNAGDTYTISLWWYSTAGNANTRVAVDWYDATLAYLSTSSTLIAVGAATWENPSEDFVAPAGAAFAVFGPTISGSPSNGTAIWFDDVQFLTADLPLAVSNELHRALTGTDDFIKIANVPPNGVYRDYAVKSGKSYDYYATAVV